MCARPKEKKYDQTTKTHLSSLVLFSKIITFNRRLPETRTTSLRCTCWASPTNLCPTWTARCRVTTVSIRSACPIRKAPAVSSTRGGWRTRKLSTADGRCLALPAQGSYDFWAPPTALFWVMVCMMNFVEINRLTEYANPGFRTKQSLAGLEKGMGGTGNPAYPGGSFNPMGMGKNDMDAMKVKEIKNGRLAMMAFFGIMVQAIITGEGPVKNLTDHVTDPFAHNLLTNFANVGGVSPF